MRTYLDRLAARTSAVGSVLCVGIDPHPAALPAGFPPDVRGVEAFARLLVESTLELAAAFKPNLAFFEAFGAEGLAALERVRRLVPEDVPVIGDAKRADIGSTAERQAVALFDRLGLDAVTVNPYLGIEAIAPLVERPDRFAYVLCRTSNPGAGEVQALTVAAAMGGIPAEPLYARIARRAVDWGDGTVGLVVGATAADDLARVRSIAPGLAFLVPGVGAQGGEIGPVLRDGPATAPPAGAGTGGGLLVNVSRGIADAAKAEGRADGESAPRGRPGADAGERIAAAAAVWARRLPVLS